MDLNQKMRLIRKTKRLLKDAVALYNAVFIAPYRQTAYKIYAKEDELFMILCFSEMLGLPNPVSHYTLELYPYYVKKFHQWHKRMGMERSPLDEIKCC